MSKEALRVAYRDAAVEGLRKLSPKVRRKLARRGDRCRAVLYGEAPMGTVDSRALAGLAFSLHGKDGRKAEAGRVLSSHKTEGRLPIAKMKARPSGTKRAKYATVKGSTGTAAAPVSPTAGADALDRTLRRLARTYRNGNRNAKRNVRAAMERLGLPVATLKGY
jgi:hypothetical protein